VPNRIQVQFDSSGANLYAVVRNADGDVWNGTAFETYATANLGNYDLPMTEQGTASRYYTVAFPAVAAGIYAVTIFERAGGSPAETDTALAAGAIDWDGTNIVPLSSRSTYSGGAVASVTGNVGGNVVGSVGSVTGAVGSVTGTVGSVTGNVGGNVTGSVGSVATGGITAASIATGAIDADALAADAATEIAAAVETAILNEGDLSPVLEAIRLKIEESDDDLTTAAIAAAVWSNETRSLTDKAGFSLSQAFPTNFAALGINASGHVSRVTLVDTTTTNTDMRGTDGAYTGTPPTVVQIRQEMDSNSADLDAIGALATAIKAKTDNLPADPAGLAALATAHGAGAWTTADVSGVLTTAAFNASDAQTAGTRLLTALELDGSVYRFTANALEQGPSGGGSSITAQAVRDAMKLAPSAGAAASGSIDYYVAGTYALASAPGGITVTVEDVPAADSMDIRLTRGDSYMTAQGRALTFTDTGNTWPNNTPAILRLTSKGTVAVEKAITITPASGTGKVGTVEFTSAETRALFTQASGSGQLYQAEFVFQVDGEDIEYTVKRGHLSIHLP